jgi:hypothetical protein
MRCCVIPLWYAKRFKSSKPGRDLSCSHGDKTGYIRSLTITHSPEGMWEGFPRVFATNYGRNFVYCTRKSSDVPCSNYVVPYIGCIQSGQRHMRRPHPFERRTGSSQRLTCELQPSLNRKFLLKAIRRGRSPFLLLALLVRWGVLVQGRQSKNGKNTSDRNTTARKLKNSWRRIN